MHNIERDIKYLHENLKDKSNLSSDDLNKYILYDLYLKHPEKVDNITNSNINTKILQPVISEVTTPTKELNDIFPKLQTYELNKIKFENGEILESQLIEFSREMLREIIEFLAALNKNVSTQQEKDLFKKAFNIISNI